LIRIFPNGETHLYGSLIYPNLLVWLDELVVERYNKLNT
jgi:hypothetical protein